MCYFGADRNAILGIVDALFDHRRCVFRRFRRPHCEVTNFFGNYGEPFARLTRSRGLNRCIECQQIGLESDLINNFDDLRSFACRLLNLINRPAHLVHGLVGFVRRRFCLLAEN